MRRNILDNVNRVKRIRIQLISCLYVRIFLNDILIKKNEEESILIEKHTHLYIRMIDRRRKKTKEVLKAD